MESSLHSSTLAKGLPLEIPGFHDDEWRKYTSWQQSMVRVPLLTAEFGKARDAALNEGFDLELIYEKQNCDFVVQAGVMSRGS